MFENRFFLLNGEKDENGVIEPKGSGGIANNCDYYIQVTKVDLEDKVVLLFEVTDYG